MQPMAALYSPHGVIPALVTPLDSNGEADERALRTLVDSVLSAGVTAVSVLGSTGEGPLVPAQTRRRIVEAVVRIVDGRVAVIAGATGGPVADVCMESRAWLALGADCVLAAPPSYFLLQQREVVAYYGELASQVGGAIMVYHFPALTKVQLEAGTVAELAAIAGVVGLKDSSGDEKFLASAINAAAGTGFSVLAGSGRIASSAAGAGARGIVAASANVIPGPLVALWAALESGDEGKVPELQRLVSAVEAACRAYPFPVNWKAALRSRGLECGRPIPPLMDLSDGAYEALGQSLDQLLGAPVGGR